MTQDNNFYRSRVYSDSYHSTIAITNVELSEQTGLEDRDKADTNQCKTSSHSEYTVALMNMQRLFLLLEIYSIVASSIS